MIKRWLFILALSLPVFGATPVTVTGTVQAPNGALATSGYVEFDLIPQNAALTYTVTGTTILAPQKGKCGINASGLLKNLALSGVCTVWGNDVISPGNSLYKVIIAPNGTVVNILQNVVIAGTAVDLSSLTLVSPQPVIGTVIKGSPLVTQSVVPSIDQTWNIGSPLVRYSTGYFNNVSFLNCIACTYKLTPTFLSVLPTCTPSVEGLSQSVVDSTINTWGSIITGGGSNHVLAYCDGTNWTVAAK